MKDSKFPISCFGDEESHYLYEVCLRYRFNNELKLYNIHRKSTAHKKLKEIKEDLFIFGAGYYGHLYVNVFYHLIEDDVFENYMKTLFAASTKFVIMYTSNKTGEQWAQHVKHRKFTDWIEINEKKWELLQFIQNKYPATDNGDNPNTSFSDFFIYYIK